MKNPKDSGGFPKPSRLFIAVALLLSIFGGYQLSHLIDGMDETNLKRTEKILAMEGSIDDATIALGRQIQEWKDMLLRINDSELYSKHRQAFFDSSRKVQEALMRTMDAMRNDGMSTSDVEQLLLEHQALNSDYLFAKSALNPKSSNSYLEADKLVIGMDRGLQQHIAKVKSDIEGFTEQQLKQPIPMQGSRYLFGFVGALSLLVMSLVGFFFAHRN